MQIQPADFGANLTSWLKTMGKNWRALLLSSLVAYVPLAVIATIAFSVADLGSLFERLEDPQLVEGLSLSELVDLLTPIFFASLVAAALQWVATAFVYLASARAVASDLAGREPDWRSMSRFALRRLIPAFAASLVFLLGLIGALTIAGVVSWIIIASVGPSFGTVFLVAVIVLTAIAITFWLGMSLSLYPQAIAMADRGVGSSLRESFRLVQPRFWPTVGFVLVTGLIASAVVQVASLALYPIFLAGTVVPLAVAVGYGLLALMQGPVAAAIGAAYAIWYVDLRARSEPLTPDMLLD